MSLYTLSDPGDLIAPSMVAAFDGWVDAGAAATTALEQLIDDASVVARFDADVLFDYRARRPPLEIVDGKLTELTWHELVVRRVRFADKDLLVLVGAEPDYRWREFTNAVVEIARALEVAEWISLGAIPAAVPHTRPVPIIGTEAAPGLLRGEVLPGPAGRAPRSVRAGLGARARGLRGRDPGAWLLRAGPALRLGPVRHGVGRAVARARQSPRRRAPERRARNGGS